MKPTFFVLTSLLMATPVFADALDSAIISRVQDDQKYEAKSGPLNTATSHEKHLADIKLTDQQKATLAVNGLADTVASTHQIQHAVTHGTNGVAQLPGTRK